MEITQDKKNSILNKIQALRNISQSTHSQEEAETCVAMIAKLTVQYQLTEIELVAGSPAKSNIDLQDIHIIYQTGRSTPWRVELACGLADLYGLFIYSFRGDDGNGRTVTKFRIIGQDTDIELAEYAFGYMERLIKSLADAAYPCGGFGVDRYGKLVQKRGVNPEKESWSTGCVRGFLHKMRTEKTLIMKDASSTALAIITNKAAEAKSVWSKATGQSLGKAVPSKAQTDVSAYVKGFEKGKTLSVK